MTRSSKPSCANTACSSASTKNTQPLSEAGALQLIHTVLDKHMDQLMAFDQGGDELGKFSTIAGNVFTLSNAIAGAMIGSDCTRLRRSRGTRARMG